MPEADPTTSGPPAPEPAAADERTALEVAIRPAPASDVPAWLRDAEA